MVEMHRKVLMRTNMMDSIMETYPDGNAPQELEQRRDLILQERDELKAKVCNTAKISDKFSVCFRSILLLRFLREMQ